MVNKPKVAGTNAESAVVRYLRDHGHPQAERRSLRGGEDWGDITGTPGLCWEVKAGKTLKLAQWLRETERERVSSRSDFGILVIKPVGMGATRTGQWWAAMYEGDYAGVVNEFGWREHAGPLSPYQSPPMDPDPRPASKDKLFFQLSGSKIKHLSQTMKEQMYLHSAILIAPKGVKSRGNWYVVTTLERLNTQLLMAGYGDE